MSTFPNDTFFESNNKTGVFISFPIFSYTSEKGKKQSCGSKFPPKMKRFALVGQRRGEKKEVFCDPMAALRQVVKLLLTNQEVLRLELAL